MRHLLLAALLLLLAVPVSASTGLTLLDETFQPAAEELTPAGNATVLPSPATAAAYPGEMIGSLGSLDDMIAALTAELRFRDQLINGVMALMMQLLGGAMPATASCLPGMACPPSSQAPLSATALTPGCGVMASACRNLSRGCPTPTRPTTTSSCPRSSSSCSRSSSCSSSRSCSSGRPSCLAAAPRVVRSCGR